MRPLGAVAQTVQFYSAFIYEEPCVVVAEAIYGLILFNRVKTGASLTDVGAELVMTDDPGFRIVALKLAQQVEQGTTLGVGAGIGRLIILVQPALITDTYALIVLCHDIIWVFCYFFCHSEKKREEFYSSLCKVSVRKPIRITICKDIENILITEEIVLITIISIYQ